jgi:hypothetical protein
MGAYDHIPDDSIPNAEAEAGLIPIFVDRMRIVPCPQVIVVDVEHTLTRKACVVCPQNVM